MELNKIEVVEVVEEIDWCLKAINAPYAWSKSKGEGVKIVVIDTGADVSHSDIKENIKYQLNTISRNKDVSDTFGHGTHVAGLLVGDNTGVAPMAELHVIKVLDEKGYGTIADVMDGITYAMSVNADVLSVSLGAPYSIPLILEQRIIQAYERGMIIVSAVGNDGRSEPLYPSRMKEVIGVGGYDKDFNPTNFSNRGHNILAPSVDILSTFKDGKYARMTGTSFASPLVAGAVALILSYCKKYDTKLSKEEIVNLLGKKLDLSVTFSKLDNLICEKKGHEFVIYPVSTGYGSNEVEKAGYCEFCGYDTHGKYFD